jgi:NADPH:quinone reductase-like Zn-dependent oxidoreductase
LLEMPPISSRGAPWRTGGKRECVDQFGLDEIIDYTEVDFADAVRDVDVIFDNVGGDTEKRSLNMLRPGGHLVTGVADEASMSPPRSLLPVGISAASRSTRIRSDAAGSST